MGISNSFEVKKENAARVAVFSNAFLIFIKSAIGIITGSISIIADALHSGIDLVASVMTMLAVKYSEKKPDSGHPYGHGKIENISGTIESILIFLGALIVAYEAIEKIIKPSLLSHFSLGLAVMAISSIINFKVSRHLFGTSIKTRSIALKADSVHLMTDVYSSAAVFAGLALAWITGYHVFDPIMALGISLFIVWEGIKILKNSVAGLLDSSLSEEELAKIEKVLGEKTHLFTNFRNLRSRRVGSQRKVDLIIEFCHIFTLYDVHKICDEIEKSINDVLPDTEVLIHPEPCSFAQNQGHCMRRMGKSEDERCQVLCEILSAVSAMEETFLLKSLSFERNGRNLNIYITIRGNLNKKTLVHKIREKLKVENISLIVDQL